MKNRAKRRIFSLLTALVMICSAVMPVMAVEKSAEHGNTVEYVQNNNGKVITVRKISMDELPDGVVPRIVGSHEEGIAFIKNFFAEVPSNEIKHNDAAPEAGTYGDALIDSQQFGVLTSGLLLVELKVQYHTTGSGSTGSIDWTMPYTQATGLTLECTWTETACSGYVTSSGKDYYASAVGQVSYYVMGPAGIEVATGPAYLSGYAYIIR